MASHRMHHHHVCCCQFFPFVSQALLTPKYITNMFDVTADENALNVMGASVKAVGIMLALELWGLSNCVFQAGEPTLMNTYTAV
jgi:hypothetical protein